MNNNENKQKITVEEAWDIVQKHLLDLLANDGEESTDQIQTAFGLPEDYWEVNNDANQDSILERIQASFKKTRTAEFKSVLQLSTGPVDFALLLMSFYSVKERMSNDAEKISALMGLSSMMSGRIKSGQ